VTFDPTERALIAAAEELNARIANCYEEVDCPKCGAPVGVRCYRVGATRFRTFATPLKHPHRERWTRVVPAR
jgi:hypothetical protein